MCLYLLCVICNKELLSKNTGIKKFKLIANLWRFWVFLYIFFSVRSTEELTAEIYFADQNLFIYKCIHLSFLIDTHQPTRWRHHLRNTWLYHTVKVLKPIISTVTAANFPVNKSNHQISLMEFISRSPNKKKPLCKQQQS